MTSTALRRCRPVKDAVLVHLRGKQSTAPLRSESHTRMVWLQSPAPARCWGRQGLWCPSQAAQGLRPLCRSGSLRLCMHSPFALIIGPMAVKARQAFIPAGHALLSLWWWSMDASKHASSCRGADPMVEAFFASLQDLHKQGIVWHTHTRLLCNQYHACRRGQTD